MIVSASFVAVAATAIATPGPGVLLTVTLAAGEGLRRSFSGMAGIALAGAVLAIVAAGSIMGIARIAPGADDVLRGAGIVCLAYLGARAWRHRPAQATASIATRSRIAEGFLVQISNPHALLFFLAVFPQFLRPDAAFGLHWFAMVVVWALLLFCIHGAYAACARIALRRFASDRASRAFHRASGTAYLALAMVSTLEWI